MNHYYLCCKVCRVVLNVYRVVCEHVRLKYALGNRWNRGNAHAPQVVSTTQHRQLTRKPALTKTNKLTINSYPK